MTTNNQEQQKYTVEETGEQLREMLEKVEALQPLLSDLSRDELLELWMKRDDNGRYGNAIHQFALYIDSRHPDRVFFCPGPALVGLCKGVTEACYLYRIYAFLKV
jgi:hypothetical protein